MLVGRSAGAAAKVLLSVSVARRVVGQWLLFRGSQGVERRAMAREERGGDKNPGFPLLCYACGGEEEEKQCRSKRHRLVLFFFFFFFKTHETASFWRKRAVSFKFGARNAPTFTSVPQLFLFLSIASLPISVLSAKLAAFSTLVLGL